MDSDVHTWNGKQKAIVATTIVMMSLSTFSFVLRLFARWQVGTKLWWDDYCAFIALVCTIKHFYNSAMVWCTTHRDLGLLVWAERISCDRLVQLKHNERVLLTRVPE